MIAWGSGTGARFQRCWVTGLLAESYAVIFAREQQLASPRCGEEEQEDKSH